MFCEAFLIIGGVFVIVMLILFFKLSIFAIKFYINFWAYTLIAVFILFVCAIRTYGYFQGW